MGCIVRIHYCLEGFLMAVSILIVGVGQLSLWMVKSRGSMDRLVPSLLNKLMHFTELSPNSGSHSADPCHSISEDRVEDFLRVIDAVEQFNHDVLPPNRAVVLLDYS